MDTDLLIQTQTVLSSLSTATDLSQEFSPPKLKQQSSAGLQYAYNSAQNTHKDFQERHNPAECLKKPIFKIIRESKNSQNLTIPLNKDFGNYNRKEKSLGELSKRLLIMFGRVDECVISLDNVTQQLGVERRRIYDIINILESLGVVYRKGKNSYQWKGLKSIHQTIKKLQRENITQLECKISDDDLDSDDEDSTKLKSTMKREKSLGLLSTGFIKLFLSWKGTISLEQAGRKLSSEHIEENKIKTKIRRLYDIANVFSSLGLIKKTCLESKKPAYEWFGIPGLDAFLKRLHSSSDEREIFQEVSSKIKEKCTPVPEKKTAEKQPSFNIQSDNSAFKPRETPLINPDIVENLLCTLLSLYRNQNQNKIDERGSLSNLLLRQMPEPPRFVKHASSPARYERSNLIFSTPTIRKSVSIIQRADGENKLSTDKPRSHGVDNSPLEDKTNVLSNIKRRASQELNEFESRTTKRIHSFIEFGTGECPSTRPLGFQNRENISIGAKSSLK